MILSSTSAPCARPFSRRTLATSPDSSTHRRSTCSCLTPPRRSHLNGEHGQVRRLPSRRRCRRGAPPTPRSSTSSWRNGSRTSSVRRAAPLGVSCEEGRIRERVPLPCPPCCARFLKSQVSISLIRTPLLQRPSQSASLSPSQPATISRSTRST